MKHRKQMLTRLLCLLLGASIVLLSGCGNHKQDKDNQNEVQQTSAKGRYVEENVQLPSGLTNIFSLSKLDDNSLTLTGSSSSSAFTVYTSADQGKNWQDKPPKTTFLSSGQKVAAVAVDGKGNMAVGYGVPDANTGVFQDALSYCRTELFSFFMKTTLSIP